MRVIPWELIAEGVLISGMVCVAALALAASRPVGQTETGVPTLHFQVLGHWVGCPKEAIAEGVLISVKLRTVMLMLSLVPAHESTCEWVTAHLLVRRHTLRLF